MLLLFYKSFNLNFGVCFILIFLLKNLLNLVFFKVNVIFSEIIEFLNLCLLLFFENLIVSFLVLLLLF